MHVLAGFADGHALDCRQRATDHQEGGRIVLGGLDPRDAGASIQGELHAQGAVEDEVHRSVAAVAALAARGNLREHS